ncbi:MAG: SIS domain-containing protein [Erysipelotrichia bacterium]|nr:SIS domain-containing protein [Erysipelotrichia bacterium]NCC54133.1 SIS domain-containing protein [Erysipelotrichia bacterium]
MEKMTMQDYVKETPAVCKKNIENYESLVADVLAHIQTKEIRMIWLIASGSSYNSCYCARAFMRKCLSCEIKIVTPFTFTYYENDIQEKDVVFVISQSGLSTNAIEAIKKLKSMQVKAIALTGNVHSDIKEYADVVIDYGVGEELVGYVTKGVSTLCLFLMLVAIVLSGKKQYLEDVKTAIAMNEEMIDKANTFIDTHYKHFSSMAHAYFCGANANYGTALEGSLKVGETIHVPSCFYEIEEYIHGPNLQLTPLYNVFFFDGNDSASERVAQVYLASREVSDRVYMISNHAKFKNDDHVISLSKEVMSECCPLAYLPFVQLLSYRISSDLNSSKQHPLLRKFKQIASAKTENFVNYDEDD